MLIYLPTPRNCLQARKWIFSTDSLQVYPHNSPIQNYWFNDCVTYFEKTHNKDPNLWLKDLNALKDFVA